MKYADLRKEFLSIPRAQINSIGKSLFSEDIYAVHIGTYNAPQVIVQAAIHAREWITTLLVTRQTQYFMRGSPRYGVYFLPCLNPDGVRLAIEGVGFVKDKLMRDFLVEINKGDDFRLYKANGRGVDLNTNFDALWGRGKLNIRYPYSENYIGPYPMSEPETKAIAAFTHSVQPALTISYHTKGQVVYYGFPTQNREELSLDKVIAEDIATAIGYTAIETQSSTGGYKDWCTAKLKIPSFTIEVGADMLAHPVGIEMLDELFLENIRLFEVIERYI